jgi:predicted ATPase
MFDSLHIRGFRAFEDLQLTGLGRVNLLVGENNIGKTTVLEALKIRCAGRAAPWELIRILEERQEVGRDRLTEGEPQPEWDIRRVFHSGSNGTTERPQPKISIGPVDEP